MILCWLKMLIYLIGPSGVGKTSCARIASMLLDAQPHNMDELCKGREFDWPFCHDVLANLENQDHLGQTTGIVDIGAGTQTLPQLRDFLSARTSRVILFDAPPFEVIKRNPLGIGRSPHEYESTEYVSRRDLYSTAARVLDVTRKSQAAAGEVFIELLLAHFDVCRK
jgi:hypothetical protein